jgi:transcriptional regulator of acetoin/glycerol metabolism
MNVRFSQNRYSSSIIPLVQWPTAHILAVLQATRWNRKAAARQLGIGHATLFRRLRQYGQQA